MCKDFAVVYLKRVAMIGPFVALFVLVPPTPIAGKIVAMGAFFVILLIAQLLELVVGARTATKAARRGDERQPIPVRAGSRRERRLLMEKAEREHVHTAN